ncbi:hypothetical protein [Pedobacter cryophilus]|uniref:hypothetical protein n=1 Tax=Pedobacter cryophilus TaxID=2571271 RepID=UPI00145F5F3A|nr:hypothetical protein [Pedobacter cryophilus]
MKKLLIIVFVVISAVAAAATINKSNTDQEQAKQLPTQKTVDTPRNAELATWD